MQSGPVFITLVSVSIVRSEPLKKKKQTRKGKEWTEMKENIEKKRNYFKRIYDPSGSDHEQSYLAFY